MRTCKSEVCRAKVKHSAAKRLRSRDRSPAIAGTQLQQGDTLHPRLGNAARRGNVPGWTAGPKKMAPQSRGQVWGVVHI